MCSDSANSGSEGFEIDVFAEVNSMVEPLDTEKPDSVLFHFFFTLVKGECDKSWKLITRYSQQKIIDSLYEAMVNQDSFYLQNRITKKDDLKKAFEENDSELRSQFWYDYALGSSADAVVEYGEYKTNSVKANKAIVDVVFKMQDGLETRIPYQMFNDGEGWKIGIVESASIE